MTTAHKGLSAVFSIFLAPTTQAAAGYAQLLSNLTDGLLACLYKADGFNLKGFLVLSVSCLYKCMTPSSTLPSQFSPSTKTGQLHSTLAREMWMTTVTAPPFGSQ